MKQALQLSVEIENEMVPDKREAIYDLVFEESGECLIVRGETNLSNAKLALFEGLANKRIRVIDSLKVLPDGADSLCWGLITVSVCNLRVYPEHSSELASQALLGTPIRVLKKKTSWYLVQTPDNYISWVDSDAVFLISEQEMLSWKRNAKVIYKPSFGWALNPESHERTTDLVAGSILILKNYLKESCLLSMPDGRIVEVSRSDVDDFNFWKNNCDFSVSELTKTAVSCLGIPYLWGGTSPKAFDCSGFVKMVYYMNGVVLARDASLQYRFGEIVNTENGWQDLNEGDLVFFGRQAANGNSEKVTHVGYYLGNSEFIHASGFVRVNSFDPKKVNYSEYRTNSLLGGRRIVNSVSNKGITGIATHPWY